MSGSKDKNVMVWDVATACESAMEGRQNGPDTSASLAEQISAVEGALSTASSSPSVTATNTPVSGGKRKRGGEDGVAGPRRREENEIGGAGLWSSTGGGPSHGPVHTFRTRTSGVIK